MKLRVKESDKNPGVMGEVVITPESDRDIELAKAAIELLTLATGMEPCCQFFTASNNESNRKG